MGETENLALPKGIPFFMREQTLKPDAFGWNQHRYGELAICTGGQGLHKTLTAKDPVGKGTVVWMPPQVPHTWSVRGHLDLLFIQWAPNFLSPLAAQLRTRSSTLSMTKWQRGHHVMSFSGPSWAAIWQYLKLLKSAHEKGARSQAPRGPQPKTRKTTREVPGPNKSENGSELKFLLAALLCHTYQAAAEPRTRPAPGISRSTPMDRVLPYLQGHYKQKIKVESLAESLGISPDHFTRLFKAHTGYHLGEYLHDLRVREACGLLSDPAVTILDVAHHLGYRHPAHFIRVFYKITGLTPEKWRRGPPT